MVKHILGWIQHSQYCVFIIISEKWRIWRKPWIGLIGWFGMYCQIVPATPLQHAPTICQEVDEKSYATKRDRKRTSPSTWRRCSWQRSSGAKDARCSGHLGTSSFNAGCSLWVSHLVSFHLRSECWTRLLQVLFFVGLFAQCITVHIRFWFLRPASSPSQSTRSPASMRSTKAETEPPAAPEEWDSPREGHGDGKVQAVCFA